MSNVNIWNMATTKREVRMNQEIYEQKKEHYESKKARRIENLENRAENKAIEAHAVFEQAKKMADVIPFGQPILVGHHSEKRDRNYRAKIDNKFRKSFELHDEAKDAEQKLHAAQNNHAISSDNPDAIKLLEEKIARLQKEHAEWKALVPNPNAKSIFDKDSAHWRSLEMTSKNAEIRRLKKRIEELKAQDALPDYAKEINGVKIEFDRVANRLKMEFNGKPAPEIIAALKSAGFHWSKFEMKWMRMMSNAAIYYAEKIAGDVKP